MARHHQRRSGAFARGLGVFLLLLGGLLAALAVAALAADLLPLVVGGPVRLTAAGELWFRLDPASLNVMQAVVQRFLHPALWDPAIVSVLTVPTWLVLGLPGAVLLLLGGWLRAR